MSPRTQRALAKLEQVLPNRLRRRVNALQSQTIPVPRYDNAPTADPELLAALALACRDWRTFRADRMGPPRQPTGPRFRPRQLPQEDLAAHVAGRVSAAAWRHRAQVTVHAPATGVVARVNPAVGMVTAVDDETCVLDTGADTIQTLAVHIGLLGYDFEVRNPPELVAHLKELAGRYLRATD